MKKQGFTIYSCNWLFALPLICCLIACIRQDVSDCALHTLNIKVVDANGNEITQSGSVETVSAYLFDGSGFIRMISIPSFESSLLGSEIQKEYTIVAWGNLKDDTLSLPSLTPGMSIEESQLRLIQKENGYHLPVTNLYYGRKEFGKSYPGSNETITIVLKQATASISVRAKHLTRRFGTSESAFQFVVRATSNSIDFLGQPIESETLFKPRSIANDKGELYAPPFHIFPTSNAEGIEIDIVRDGKVLFTATVDEEGRPLHALINQLLYVEINFPEDAEAEVNVSVAPWEDDFQQDTEI